MESYDAAKLLHSFCNLHIELCQLSVLAHVELEQNLFAVLRIKFLGYAKEEAKIATVTGYTDGVLPGKKLR